MRKQIPSDLVKNVVEFSTSHPQARLESIRNGLQVRQEQSYVSEIALLIHCFSRLSNTATAPISKTLALTLIPIPS